MGTKTAVITIVVPVYNRARLVRRTLDSIAAQTIRPLQLVIVDNGSTDDTLSVVADWQEDHLSQGFSVTLLQESRPGACAARNRGLGAVSTPYVMFFDSDDVMSPNHVADVVNAIEAKGNPDLIYWGTTRHMLDGSVVRHGCRRGDRLYNHIFHATLATQCWAAKTSIVKNAGAWNESLAGWNDYELGIRLLLASRSVASLKVKDNVHIYLQEVSITGTNFGSDCEKWERSLTQCEAILREAGREDMLKYIDVRRCVLSGLYGREGRKEESNRLLGEVLSRETNACRRRFYRFVNRYVQMGGRGVSILSKLFLR